MAAPYSAERGAVSLTFLRRFYDTRVKPAELAAEGGCEFSTDTVVKRFIMRDAWDSGDGGCARRMVERLQPGEVWGGPESGTDMCERLVLPAPGCLCRQVCGWGQRAPSEPAPRVALPPPFQTRFFISHAFGNPLGAMLEVLESHFRSAGATPDRVFVWLDGVPPRLRAPPAARLPRAAT